MTLQDAKPPTNSGTNDAASLVHGNIGVDGNIDEDEEYNDAGNENNDMSPMNGHSDMVPYSPPAFYQQPYINDNPIPSSRSSSDSRKRYHITLEDHTDEPDAGGQGGLWAKSVAIDDHATVKGKSGGGAYTVWICKIALLVGNIVTVRMRYSEFVQLRSLLRSAFPNAYKNSIPRLPPKNSFSMSLCIRPLAWTQD